MLKQYRVMAAYNRKMNQQFYAACAKLTEAEHKQDRRVFFTSIHGTLNHLLLVDRLWLGGFTDNPQAFATLDTELYADFDELRAERERTDADILAWVKTLTVEKLEAPFSERLNFPMWLAVMHFFNHQTHHRGQLSALLGQCDLDYGVTDIPWVAGMAELATPT
jgi:uncharacterized damage-inducible protein DinB